MLTSSAHIQTQQADRLLTRLCKHWAHKFPVSHSERQGEIKLPLGICRLHAAETLTVNLESNAEQTPTLQQVVTDHLQRMAGKEVLVIEWQ